MKQQDRQLFLYVGGAVATYVFIVNPILKKLGIRTSQAIQQAQQGGINNAFNPLFWKEQSGALIITRVAVDQMAAKIYNSFTIFQDDFNAVFSVFKQLKTQSQVSYLADIFRQKYNADLITFLGNGGGVLPWDGLSDTQLSKIVSYVNNLPKFKR